MKTTFTYGRCSIFMVGMEMNCPMCGRLVKSGEHHTCQKNAEAVPVKRAPKKRRQK